VTQTSSDTTATHASVQRTIYHDNITTGQEFYSDTWPLTIQTGSTNDKLNIATPTYILSLSLYVIKHDVYLTGRNRTGPPWSVGCPTNDTPDGRQPPTRPAGPPAGSVTDPDKRRRQQTTDNRLQHAKQYWPIRRASINIKQGVARRRVLPPGELRCIYAGVTDDDRRQQPLLVWPTYTMQYVRNQ